MSTSMHHLTLMALILLAPDLGKRFRTGLAFVVIVYQFVCLIGQIGGHP